MFTKIIIEALSDNDIKWICDNFAETKNDVIAEKMNISVTTLHRIARHYGLKKTTDFMKQMQANAAAKGGEKIRSETGEAKQRRADIARNNANPDRMFKKGVYALGGKSPEEINRINEKRVKTWNETRRKEISRVCLGLDQKTNFWLPKDFNPAKQKKIISYRLILRRRGYVITKRGGMAAEITAQTNRSEITEANARKLGFVFRGC